MEKYQLKASTRDLKTTNPAKLRKMGLVPAILYGRNLSNVALTVTLNEFEKVFKKAGESTIINLLTEEGKSHPVLIHDVQNHFLNSQPIHIDFYEVSMTEKLKAKVALEFVGEAKAVKELGGVLVKVLNEVEVQCLPHDLPHNIPVDISSLDTFEDTIHVKDLKVSEKVQILTLGVEVVAKVQPPRDVEAELAAPVEEKVEEVLAATEAEKEAGVIADEAKTETKEETPTQKE